jgi:hypothetical protein
MKTNFKTVSNVELNLPESSVASYSDDFGKESAEALKESLSAMSEVRKELQDTYSNNQEMIATVEQLNSAIDTFKKESAKTEKQIESLTKELKVFKEAEKQLSIVTKTKRLEKLSKDFSVLGRTKTVEELSALPESVIVEFEDLTSSTISRTNAESANIGITPSQGSINVKSTESLSEDKDKVPTKSFAESLCETLTQQQQAPQANEGKRLKRL